MKILSRLWEHSSIPAREWAQKCCLVFSNPGKSGHLKERPGRSETSLLKNRVNLSHQGSDLMRVLEELERLFLTLRDFPNV
jgi:hypothetical protein